MNWSFLRQGAGLLVLLFAVHTVFGFLALYLLYPWFDNFLHAGAGYALSLIPLGWHKLKKEDISMRAVVTMLFVFICAIAWEYIERTVGLAKALAVSVVDVERDIIATLVGSFIGYVLVRYNEKYESKSESAN